MMPVPDPRSAEPALLQKIVAAFRVVKERLCSFFPSAACDKCTLAKQDATPSCRKFLTYPNSTWMIAGIFRRSGSRNAWGKKYERAELTNRLYSYLREFLEDARRKEEKAIANKNRSKRKAALSPVEIAGQILAEIKDKQGSLLRSFSDFVDVSRPFSTFEVPATGAAEIHEDIFAPHGSVRFMKGRKQIALLPTKSREQAALVAAISSFGVRGLIRVPLDSQDCLSVKKRYETFVEDRTKRLRKLISERTGVPDLRDKVFAALNDLIDHETSS